jgi:hypothetical protein
MMQDVDNQHNKFNWHFNWVEVAKGGFVMISDEKTAFFTHFRL